MKPPPGVVPDGQGMAMDYAPEIGEWAAGAYGSEFAGFGAAIPMSILATWAQRPEYRKISDVFATEMTRRWIKLSATGDEDKSERIDRINAALARFKVRDAFRDAIRYDGLLSRGHVFIDLGVSGPELATPIGNGNDAATKAKVKKGSLKGIRSADPFWIYPQNYNARDPLAADFYNPQTWYVMGEAVHVSRLLPIVAREVPDLLKPAYAFGGLSLTQMAQPYVDNWVRTRQNVADIVNAFSVFVLKTNMGQQLQIGGGTTGLVKVDVESLDGRVEAFNYYRNNRGTLVIDKESEDFANISAPLGTLDKLQAQAQEQMASVSSIPLVKLLGVTPSGLNASSDGEIRVFYDTIHASQEDHLRDPIQKVIDVIQLSEFGDVDPDITFGFEPLWSMSEKEQAEVRKIEAETDGILVQEGIILSSEARLRVANDPDTPYAGLDADLEIDPPDPGETDPPVPDPTLQAAADTAWEESKHPRDDDGKFGTNKKKNVATAVSLAKSLGYQAKEWSSPKSASAAVFSDGTIHINSAHKHWADPVKSQKALADAGHLSSDNPAHVIHHEIGHALYDPPDNFMGGGAGPHSDIAGQVSKYAKRNPKEFVSEVHAALQAGKTFSPEVMMLFEQYARKREGVPVS